MHVIPSIDVDNINDFSHQIARLNPYYHRFHIDYADEAFVPFRSVTIIEAITALKQLPELELDFHLMTAHVLEGIELIKTNGVDLKVNTVFIHHKASPYPNLFKSEAYPFRLGLVLNPEDSVDTIAQTYTLSNIQNILIMTVVPGPQGSPFLSHSLNKIDQLRNAGYRNKIHIDGGVNVESLKQILNLNNLPDFVCPGSYFSHAQNIEERVQYLSQILTHENHSNQNPSNNDS